MIKRIFINHNINTNNGTIVVVHNFYSGITNNCIVTKDCVPAADGKYKILKDDDLIWIKVKKRKN